MDDDVDASRHIRTVYYLESVGFDIHPILIRLIFFFFLHATWFAIAFDAKKL